MSNDVHGIVNLIKPVGMTSFFAVRYLKRLLDCKKAGHTGTLDPLACGLLTICVGRGTKIIPYLPEEKKEYIAEVTLGVTTETLDREGKITGQSEAWRQVTEEDIEQVLQDYIGKIEQIPPMFSAVHHKGQRLYKLAREGKTVERESRKVEIFQLELLRVDLPVIQLRVVCSRGTYIRSLARDLGSDLGSGAHLSFLIRRRVGPFNLQEADTFEELEEKVTSGSTDVLIPVDYPLKYPRLAVDNKAHKKAIHGNILEMNNLHFLEEEVDLQEGDRVRVYTPQEKFISVSEIKKTENGELVCQPLRVFIEL
ncbi:MAG: tRNA pseudouridine(55) synthase TruB [Halanaerobiaceae bacterium]